MGVPADPIRYRIAQVSLQSQYSVIFHLLRLKVSSKAVSDSQSLCTVIHGSLTMRDDMLY